MAATVACTAEAITTFDQLRERARELPPRRLGVVCAEDEVALTAAADALALGLTQPVLFGNASRIRSLAERLSLDHLLRRAEFPDCGDAPTSEIAKTAVRMARDGAIDILMKGHVRTDEMLHPVLDREHGLRTGNLLCDVAVCEVPRHCSGAGGPRLIALSDGGINVAPTLDQKRQILHAALNVLRRLGIARPRVAVMSALEVVTTAMPSTGEARALSEMGALGEFPDADVYGPLALDGALLEWAARAKNVANPVAGHADLLLMPNIEAANCLAKAVLFLARWRFAHVVAGAAVPILIPSRVEDAENKVNSIALGVLYAAA